MDLLLLKIFFFLIFQNILVVGDSEACAMKFGALESVRAPNEIVDVVCSVGTRVSYWENGRISSLLSQKKYDFVIVFLGTNDYGSPVKGNKIAKQITDSGAKCIWVGPTLVRGKTSSTNDSLRNSSSPCSFLDTQSLQIPLADGIHPTRAGALKWIKAIWERKSQI